MSGFRYPNITGISEKEQLRQLKSYLYQLVEQLNNTTVLASENVGISSVRPQISSVVTPESDDTAAENFAALKGLIIKSADIVEAYCEKFDRKFSGKYVAQSEFGSYVETTSGQISAESTRIDQKYQSLQTVVTGLQTKLLETEGYIRTGLLYYAGETDPLPAGTPVYGVEVGQAEGDEFKRFSRFTSYGLTFFDQNGTVCATITEGKLQIGHAVVQSAFTEGGFTDEVLSDGSLVTRWKGM